MVVAPPGLGVGDIVAACNYIVTKCQHYRDSVKEFDEIANKAQSTTTVLRRLENEAQTGGSLVERAGPGGYEELQFHLKSVREDVVKLRRIVEKYDDIHEYPGSRLHFAFKESSNLTDLRRRIDLHEQSLRLWYDTLVYGSLRRLENGQEQIFNAIRLMNDKTLAAVMAELRRGNERPLIKELSKQGIPEETICQNIDVAAHYVSAPPAEKIRLETLSRSKSSTAPGREAGFSKSYDYHDDDRGFGDKSRKSRSKSSMGPGHDAGLSRSFDYYDDDRGFGDKSRKPRSKSSVGPGHDAGLSGNYDYYDDDRRIGNTFRKSRSRSFVGGEKRPWNFADYYVNDGFDVFSHGKPTSTNVHKNNLSPGLPGGWQQDVSNEIIITKKPPPTQSNELSAHTRRPSASNSADKDDLPKKLFNLAPPALFSSRQRSHSASRPHSLFLKVNQPDPPRGRQSSHQAQASSPHRSRSRPASHHDESSRSPRRPRHAYVSDDSDLEDMSLLSVRHRGNSDAGGSRSRSRSYERLRSDERSRSYERRRPSRSREREQED